MIDLYPLRLEPTLLEKPWGVRDLSPYFGTQDRPVGEVWYTYSTNRIANGALAGRSIGELTEEYGARLRGAGGSVAESPGDYFPILAKLLFVSQKLSVQVHPADAYARRVEGGCGKTEMWHVVAAQPGARVALGLTRPLDREELIATARSGEIERYLNWIDVNAGDTLFVPAGLVHTIGPGVTICEIQQHSDLTYRLFDFGRKDLDGRSRELHLDKAADVVEPGSRHEAPPVVDLASPHVSGAGRMRRRLLAYCDYFAAERLEWEGRLRVAPDPARFELIVVLAGEGTLAGEPYRPGSAFLIPADAPAFEIDAASPTAGVRAYPPQRAALRAEIDAASPARVP